MSSRNRTRKAARLSSVNISAQIQTMRQAACRVRGPEQASRRRGFCHTHRVAFSQVTPCKPADRNGGSRFLQTDPIPGGSANAYDYCSQDPINCTDLNGELGWSSIGHFFKKAARLVKKAAVGLYRHGTISYAGCFVVCADFTFQHGHIYGNLGGSWGFLVSGWTYGFTTARAQSGTTIRHYPSRGGEGGTVGVCMFFV